MKIKKLPSQAELQDKYTYNPKTGSLVFKKTKHRSRLGKQVGTSNGSHLKTLYEGQMYQVHRLVWMYVTGDDPGEKFVDHIDGDPMNNRWNNLRLADHSENLWNTGCQKNNPLSLKGIRKNTNSERWSAKIMVNGKLIGLGSYDTPEEAHLAYCAASAKYHKQFSKT